MVPDKLRRNLIIIFSIIFILIVTIFVLYNVTDIFRTKRGVFFRYFGQISEITKVLDMSEEYKEYQKTKKNNPYITTGEMVIADSKNIADASILNKVKLTLNGKTDTSNGKSNKDIVIKSATNELFNMTVSKDKDLYGFFAPQIADGYIVVRNKDLDTLAKNMKLNNSENVPKQFMFPNIEEILSTSSAEKRRIAKYIKMIRNKAPDTAYSKEDKRKIEIEGQKYETTASILKLNSEQSSSLQIELLEELSTDSVMMNYITSKCKLLNLAGDCTEINLLNAKIKERIEALKNNKVLAKDITVTVYEYKQKNVQTRIQIGGITIKISHLNIDEKEIVKIEIEEENNKKIFKIQKSREGYNIKIWQEEDSIVNSVEFKYNITGTVEQNNIENYLTIKLINDIKEVTFEYKDKIEFTNDIGTLKDVQDGKVAVINDYAPNEIKDFVDLVKKQINSVYVNKAASIGVNLEPIFKIE